MGAVVRPPPRSTRSPDAWADPGPVTSGSPHRSPQRVFPPWSAPVRPHPTPNGTRESQLNHTQNRYIWTPFRFPFRSLYRFPSVFASVFFIDSLPFSPAATPRITSPWTPPSCGGRAQRQALERPEAGPADPEPWSRLIPNLRRLTSRRVLWKLPPRETATEFART